VIYKYEPNLVPGLFQTEEYARAVCRRSGSPTPRAALVTPAGDATVMRGQLEHLRELAARPGISLHVLPFSAGVHPGLGGAFTVLQFDDVDLSGLLYLEGPERESVSRDEEGAIKKHVQLFVQLQERATPLADVDAVLRRTLEERFEALPDGRAPAGPP